MSKSSDAWLKLTQVVSSVEADLGAVLQVQHELGLSEFRALEILARSKHSELRMQELASHLRLHQSSVARMAERLERAGLTVRDLCPDDKRGVFIVLTREGRKRLEGAQPNYEKALEAALKKHGAEKLPATQAAKVSRS